MLTGSCLCQSVRWTYSGDPATATACNCTRCRRYGVLWIYGYQGEGVTLSGETLAYAPADSLAFHSCPTCGATAAWRSLRPDAKGRIRIAVNLRLADDPEAVMDVPISRFEGLESFTRQPPDGRVVRDLWF